MDKNGSIQEEKGKRLKRWNIGRIMLNNTCQKKWLIQKIIDPIILQALEERIDTRIYVLTDTRDDLNDRKQMINRKIKAMEAIREG